MRKAMKATNKSSASGGFSLVEVLIALTILAIGILVIAQMQAAAIKGLAFGRHMSNATQIAQQQLEFLRSLGYSDLLPNAAPVVDDATYTDGSGNSVFLDEVLGDGNPSSWHFWSQPVNDEGELVSPDSGGMKYWVRWRVERGGPVGTNPPPGQQIGIPGPGQMVISMEVIWWEKNEVENPDLGNLSAVTIRNLRGRIVTLETLRQTDF